MATVPSASPRPSLSHRQSPPSSRTSIDTVSTITTRNEPNATGAAPRRNRAALRDYYKLKSPTPAESALAQAPARSDDDDDGASAAQPTRLQALDRDGFEAGGYVRELLEAERLEGLLGVERELVGEVRALDGERKALVYDNYSKLIAATETILKMRSNMDPLTPATITLAPAVAHIADTAAALAAELAEDESAGHQEALVTKKNQVQLIRRALQGPQKLQILLAQDQRHEAHAEWKLVQSILRQCSSAADAKDVYDKCHAIMSTVQSDEED